MSFRRTTLLDIPLLWTFSVENLPDILEADKVLVIYGRVDFDRLLYTRQLWVQFPMFLFVHTFTLYLARSKQRSPYESWRPSIKPQCFKLSTIFRGIACCMVGLNAVLCLVARAKRMKTKKSLLFCLEWELSPEIEFIGRWYAVATYCLNCGLKASHGVFWH